MKWLGVDVGFVYAAVDSDGQIYRWAGRRRNLRDFTNAGPVTIQRKGSTRTYDPYTPEEFADVVARGGPQILVHQALRSVALRVVKKARRSCRGIALEDWPPAGRRQSWVRLHDKIGQLGGELDVPVMRVDRAYTSITCPQCHFCRRGNRPARNVVLCLQCGFERQADWVAAMNLQAKAERRFELQRGTCTNPACGGAAWADELCRRCYFHRYRHAELPDLNAPPDKWGKGDYWARHARFRRQDREADVRAKQKRADDMSRVALRAKQAAEERFRAEQAEEWLLHWTAEEC